MAASFPTFYARCMRKHIGDVNHFSCFSGVTADSRQVAPGFLFAVVPGTAVHGEAYLAQAVARGATGILAEPAVCARARQVYPSLMCLETVHVRQDLARAAAHFYPEAPLFRAAVTGTNGKSSVVGFARQLWGFLGKRGASLGTLGLELSFSPEASLTPLPALTTPDPVSLHRCFHELKTQENVEAIALEAASHGLDQYRLEGTTFQAGVFTNFSRDHLDYHKDEHAYFQAKSRLFSELIAPRGKAILCADLPETPKLKEIAQRAGLEVWTYGKAGDPLRIMSWEPLPQGQKAHLSLWGEKVEVALPLLGGVQLYNSLAALAIGVASGDSLSPLISFLPQLTGIRGRLEKVGTTSQGGTLYVDYAHTPDALRVMLRALRAHTPGKLGVVFGCGGDRDTGKRFEMGQIAAQEADWAIVTDDNPRQEDPSQIRRDIRQGCPQACEVEDRQQAIFQAIKKLGPGDVAVIAGKGHETGQLVAGKTLPFRDQDVIHDILKERC